MGVESGGEFAGIDGRLLGRLAVRNRSKKCEERVRGDVRHVVSSFTPECRICQGGDMLFDLRGTPVFRQFGLGEAAEVIRERLREEAGVLEVCVGVSGLKVLSFVLAERAWPDGAVICPPGKEDDWLRSSPVEHLPGIRPSVMAKVSRWNPTSIRDLLPLSRGDLR